MSDILRSVGDDPFREGLSETPKRVAAMYIELFSGIGVDPAVEIDAIFDESHEDPVILRDLRFYSFCEHHLLPFFGQANLVYIPSGKIAGISKLARCLDVASRRPQVQERLTRQWADAVFSVLAPSAVGVLIKAEHLCMSMRGIQKPSTQIITTAIRGDPAAIGMDSRGFLELLRG